MNPHLAEILQDVKFGIRTLMKSPGFTIVALATIGIGIGGNAAIYSIVDGVLLKPSPFKEIDRMVQVLEKPPGGGRNGISTLNYLDWEKQNTVFEFLAAQRWGTVSLTGVEKPVQIPCEQVRVHFFDIFEGKARIGRLFAEGEDSVGRDHVAVISNSFWVSEFGSDVGVLGRTMILDGEPYTIIGVMPPGRFDLTSTKIWRPMSFPAGNMTRDFHWFGAWALLKRGVTLEQASAQMDALAARIAHDYPKSNKGWGVGIDSFNSILVGKDLKKSLYMLMDAVGMVLLIACANLANLTLARGISREREVALRAALGAGRWRLMRQFLTESLILSIGGGTLGLFLAYGGLAVMKTTMPEGTIPPNLQVGMDGRVLLFVLGLSIITGVLFGIVPALKATRPNLTNSIKQGGIGTSASHSSKRMRGALVISEVALAFVLLAGAGLLIRSFFQMQSAETGFDSTNVVTANLPISARRFQSATEFRLYVQQITDAVAAVPGVRDVALTSALPLEGWGYGMPFQIVGAKPIDVANRPDCFFKMVGSSYFHALRIRLTKGRLLDEHDINGATPAAVINETMAKKYFANDNPIGKQILVEEIAFAQTKLGPEIPWEIVGVVSDEKVGGLGSDNERSPGIYVTIDQSPQTYQALIVRGQTNSPLLQRSIRNAIHGVNKDQVVDSMKTLDQIKVESVAGEKFRTILMGIFAAIALILAAIGLYGVISYSVVQRTREIGIRAALGANPRNILGLILRSAMALTAFGLLLGLAGALGLSQFLSSMLFNIGKYDPETFAAVAGLLVLVTLLASLFPVRRAMKVNPIVALKCE
ncbi:MAG TPA: ABC transporter permease [Lacunisphaera sp.]|jgi:putative ABC transport system permease protein